MFDGAWRVNYSVRSDPDSPGPDKLVSSRWQLWHCRPSTVWGAPWQGYLMSSVAHGHRRQYSCPTTIHSAQYPACSLCCVHVLTAPQSRRTPCIHSAESQLGHSTPRKSHAAQHEKILESSTLGAIKLMVTQRSPGRDAYLRGMLRWSTDSPLGMRQPFSQQDHLRSSFLPIVCRSRPILASSSLSSSLQLLFSAEDAQCCLFRSTLLNIRNRAGLTNFFSQLLIPFVRFQTWNQAGWKVQFPNARSGKQHCLCTKDSPSLDPRSGRRGAGPGGSRNQFAVRKWGSRVKFLNAEYFVINFFFGGVLCPCLFIVFLIIILYPGVWLSGFNYNSDFNQKIIQIKNLQQIENYGTKNHWERIQPKQYFFFSFWVFSVLFANLTIDWEGPECIPYWTKFHNLKHSNINQSRFSLTCANVRQSTERRMRGFSGIKVEVDTAFLRLVLGFAAGASTIGHGSLHSWLLIGPGSFPIRVSASLGIVSRYTNQVEGKIQTSFYNHLSTFLCLQSELLQRFHITQEPSGSLFIQKDLSSYELDLNPSLVDCETDADLFLHTLCLTALGVLTTPCGLTPIHLGLINSFLRAGNCGIAGRRLYGVRLGKVFMPHDNPFGAIPGLFVVLCACLNCPTIPSYSLHPQRRIAVGTLDTAQEPCSSTREDVSWRWNSTLADSGADEGSFRNGVLRLESSNLGAIKVDWTTGSGLVPVRKKLMVTQRSPGRDAYIHGMTRVAPTEYHRAALSQQCTSPYCRSAHICRSSRGCPTETVGARSINLPIFFHNLSVKNNVEYMSFMEFGESGDRRIGSNISATQRKISPQVNVDWPTHVCCHRKLTCRLMIQPSFDEQSLCRLHSDCAKASRHANRWSLDDRLAGECCMSTAGLNKLPRTGVDALKMDSSITSYELHEKKKKMTLIFTSLLDHSNRQGQGLLIDVTHLRLIKTDLDPFGPLKCTSRFQFCTWSYFCDAGSLHNTISLFTVETEKRRIYGRHTHILKSNYFLAADLCNICVGRFVLLREAHRGYLVEVNCETEVNIKWKHKRIATRRGNVVFGRSGDKYSARSGFEKNK
ncbi:hypothetical protein VP01_998g2 [Puccinia sorghi]|uniref:Uncharacterized protein n=1 Tax=Puccinia sorghi TaxID=27349 RepID=A0A0L6U785_9BASI|nr:hypothetical protein VP01_998g2 [Puccinia sorghi]